MTEAQGRYEYNFQLRPFTPITDFRGFCLGGSLIRKPGVLSIVYRLAGNLPSVAWPAPCPVISRCHELWRQTCFEVFFGIPGQSAYWEVNLSPYGCWNLYHFTDYRQGMEEDAALERLTCHVLKEDKAFSLSCQIDMHKLVQDCQELEVGVAGVVLGTTGTRTYWAIDHFENVPDFHSRRSFLAVLPGVTKM